MESVQRRCESERNWERDITTEESLHFASVWRAEERWAAAGDAGGLDDGRVPQGDLNAGLGGQGGSEDGDGVFLDREAHPGGDERGSFVVGETLRASGTGGLHVKLLKHLDRENQIP